MVLSYFYAQLLPWSQGKKGSLLVLGSANVDERCLLHIVCDRVTKSILHVSGPTNSPR